MAIIQRGSILLAGDAGAGDLFGIGVAISANGLVMAVGASDWDGTYGNEGGVYIYDWSGSAWVQRGSVLVVHFGNAATNNFGFSVALSPDGSMLAVGAPGMFASGYTQSGMVHFYDWSGSAWLPRTSVADPDPAAYRRFGVAVAMSADGSTLVVGSPLYDAAYTNTGAVYTFDWNGIDTWTLRGTRLEAYDAYQNVLFGKSVSLSSDGNVLAVGSRRDATFLDQGGVYVYDRSGSSWTQRGDVLLPSDTEASDLFGHAIALNESATTLAVSAYGWDNSVGDQGGVYLFDVSGLGWTQRGSVIEEAVPSAPSQFGEAVALNDAGVLLISASGYSDTGGVYVFDGAGGAASNTGTPTAPTELTIVLPSGTPTAPTLLSVTANGTPVAPTALAVVDMAQHHPNFSAVVVIDGVDVSERLIGTVTVEAAEGAARVAGFSILPYAGVIEPLDYVGKPVSIDYALIISGTTVVRRLFTGRIDTPSFNPSTGLLRFDCVDDMQNRVAALSRSVIDGLVGGRYSTAVQGEILDNWDYAQARLSTVAGSLDAGASGGLRVTPWELTATWATFGPADLKYESSTLSFPQRSTLVNHVELEFDYRYHRLRERYASVGWSGTLIDMAPNGYQYPTQQDILGAAAGSGWQVVASVFYPAPAAIAHSSGGFIYPSQDAIDLAILKLAQRHSQTVTESYAMSVIAEESIAANGELPHAMRGALESDFDGGAWESALDVEPLMPTGGDMDWAPEATRADADYAIQTLLDQARVKILGSHRGARVGNTILCNPDLDLDKRVAVSTSTISAAGKVSLVRHVIDLRAGSATTDFEIACFGVGGAGIITPDTLAPPPPPAEAAETQAWNGELPSLTVSTYGSTPYQESLMGLLLNPPETITVEDVPTPDGPKTLSYPNPFYVAGGYPVNGFRVQMPGVDDVDRNPLGKNVTTSYRIVVPSDPITITV